jgi:hypothetical protein
LNRQEQWKINEGYIRSEGLDKLIDFNENSDYREQAFDAVNETLAIPYPPEPADLVAIHKLIRRRKCFTIMEFGVGYSTIVMADALLKNQHDWENLAEKPATRNRFMFQLFSVDGSPEWIDCTQKRIPKHLADRVHLQLSEVEAGTFNGQICHYYMDLPDIVADFIYLDGPSPKHVKGKINGLSFHCDERTVMSADLLLMESTFLPGTFILVDGRTNNARFLENNFKRKYKIIWDKDKDVTTFDLKEDKLGKYNIIE